MPLMLQVGLKMSPMNAGLMMLATVTGSMLVKRIAVRTVQRFGYKRVLTVNTLMIGVTIGLFSLLTTETPVAFIIMLGLAQGFFNSLQFSSMNSMAYADIRTEDSSMASSIASSFQQLSMSFGLAVGSLVTAWYLGDLPQSDRIAVMNALHHAFLTLGAVTLVSSLTFWTLRKNDGESVSQGQTA